MNFREGGIILPTKLVARLKRKLKNGNENDFQNSLIDKFLPLSITLCICGLDFIYDKGPWQLLKIFLLLPYILIC